ncbi:MAG: hypothetical protein KAR05_09780 [Candidatus Omnitrophica bacterium]|nr:hypothetical protein [Candidatus Omnitrophota bacterium]
MNNDIDMYNAIVSNNVSFTALIISIIALVYTIRTFCLKSGHDIRGSYSTCSGGLCDDEYVVNITLENLKDKAVVIFKIFLKIGHCYYVELENFEDKPLIIAPFEVYRGNYDPIVFYSMNMKRIKIDSILSDDKIQKQILLSTTDGKYKVKTNIRMWSPFRLYFQNYMTAIIEPKRLTCDNKSYGINVKYLVRFTGDDGETSTIPLSLGDANISRFKDFKFTKKSLKSKESLMSFFKKQKDVKKITYKKIDIIEYQKECMDRFELDKIKTIEAKPYNFFQYHIIGRFFSFLKNIKNKSRNNKIMKETFQRKSHAEDNSDNPENSHDRQEKKMTIF